MVEVDFFCFLIKSFAKVVGLGAIHISHVDVILGKTDSLTLNISYLYYVHNDRTNFNLNFLGSWREIRFELAGFMSS